MKHLTCITSVTTILLLANGCVAPGQQPWNGQTFALGGAQNGVNQQYPYSNQTANYPNSAPNGISSELGLINILVGQLGISPQQALGGVGSIFSVAQQRMNPGEFSQLSNSVPGMDRYLSSVPQQVAPSGSSGLLGAAGNLNGALGNLAVLAGSFQSLGMNANMISQFVPVMLQYVQNQGGAGTMSLLERALY